MTKYFLTNKANEDLDEIWEYTFDEWSEMQADKYYFEILNYCFINLPNFTNFSVLNATRKIPAEYLSVFKIYCV